MSLALEWKSLSSPDLREEKRRQEEKRRREILRRKQMEKARRSRLVFSAFLVVACVMSGILLLSICMHVAVVQNEVRMREAQRQIELERRRQDALRLEIASLESPARIEKEAARKLGMIPVERAEYLETPAFQAARQGGQEGIAEAQARAEKPGEGGI